jgi:hypothetical protein
MAPCLIAKKYLMVCLVTQDVIVRQIPLSFLVSDMMKAVQNP